MQRILRKRVWRNLRKNLPRYLALMAMIVLSMLLIVSIVAAADTIILGAKQYSETNITEDGEFTVFVPLTEKETSELEAKGITIEKMFYMDFQLSDDSTIRVFKNRSEINLVSLLEGNLAESKDEIVLERRYCEEHELSVGDMITIAGQSYTICGIGVSPDYEGAFKNLADSSVDSVSFGIGWVTNDAYSTIIDLGQGERAEEYVYAYLLNGSLTNDELKETLESFKFSAEDVTDPYFQEYWDATVGKQEELEDGIDELADGISELADGLDELHENSGDLKNGVNEIFEAYIDEAENTLSDFGFSTDLTPDNFEKELSGFAQALGNTTMQQSVNQLIEQLKDMKGYADGVKEYTDGVDSAQEGAVELTEGFEELRTEAEELLDEYSAANSAHNLELFIPAENNPRIGGAADDQVINKFAGLMAGVIIMVLFTYVISVFVTHEIEKDSSIIGTLYALGVTRRDLLIHYLYLPVIVTLIAGIIGMLIGFSDGAIMAQMKDGLNYFSLPAIKVRHPFYLVIYSAIMPPAVAAIVNFLVISKKLHKPALKLIRKETKQPKISRLKLKKMGFVRKFQIRQFLRELRSSLTVVFGMFISFLLLMLGLDVYVMCAHISVDNKADVNFEYMYTYKYPDDEVPTGGDEAYTETFQMENLGYQMDVTVMGINEDNPYFEVKLSDNQSDVVISSAMSQKFALKEGDTFVVESDDMGRKYAFTVSDIVPYSPSFYIFMDIDQMRELFGTGDDYFNVVFSDKELDIPTGKLYAVTSRADIEKASDIYLSLMWSMIYMMIIVAIIVFVVVMYLMMKVMVDRSAQSISLIQIFGYRTKEIRKLYLDGNFFVVAIGAAIAMPLSKMIMDAIYPYTVANAASAMNLEFPWYFYCIIYAAVLVLYFIINRILILRIRNVTPADILRSRD